MHFFWKLVQLLQAAEEFCKAKITAGMKELVLISKIRGTLPGEMKAHFHVLPCCWGFCSVLSNADVWNGKCTCLQNGMFCDSGYFSCAWVLSMDWMCILCFNFLKPWAEESLLGILTNFIAVCVPLFPSPPRDHTIVYGFLSFSFLCCVRGELLREFCVGWGPTNDSGESQVDADLLLPWSQRNLLTKTNPIFMIPFNMWIPDLVRMVCIVHDCRTTNFLCPEIVTQTFKNPKM